MVMLVPGMVPFSLSQFTSVNWAAVLQVFGGDVLSSGVHLLQFIPRAEKREQLSKRQTVEGLILQKGKLSF